MNIILTKGSCHSVGEYSFMGGGAPFLLCARDSMKAGGLLLATITVTRPSNWFHRIVRSQTPVWYYLREEPFILSSWEILKYHCDLLPTTPKSDRMCVCVFI